MEAFIQKPPEKTPKAQEVPKVPKGIEPLFDEPALIDALNPDNTLPSSSIRQLFFLCAMDCYDRKVGRQEFAEILQNTVNAYTFIRSIEFGATLSEAIFKENPEHKQEILTEGMQIALKDLASLRQRTMDKMKLVAQCAKGEDTIQ